MSPQLLHLSNSPVILPQVWTPGIVLFLHLLLSIRSKAGHNSRWYTIMGPKQRSIARPLLNMGIQLCFSATSSSILVLAKVNTLSTYRNRYLPRVQKLHNHSVTIHSNNGIQELVIKPSSITAKGIILMKEDLSLSCHQWMDTNRNSRCSFSRARVEYLSKVLVIHHPTTTTTTQAVDEWYQMQTKL